MKRLFAICCMIIVACSGACSPPKSTTVRLPSGARAPAATDPEFLAHVDSLATTGAGDSRLACLVRFVDSAAPVNRIDLGPLLHLSGDTWILWGSAHAIRALTDDASVDWIGEYKAEYKYNTTLAGASVVWVYVETFLGSRPEYDEALAALGIDDIRYIDVPGYYYLKLTGDQVVDLAEMWWVKSIYRAHRRSTIIGQL
jgi:hypothetical protein